MAQLNPPMAISDALVDAARGIAQGHKTLADESKSTVGRLVVKNAKVTLDLELTSYENVSGLQLSMKPVLFVGVTDTQQKAAQTLSVELNIVDVMDPPPPPGAASIALIETALKNLADHLASTKSASQQDVAMILAKLQAGDVAGASADLLRLLEKEPGFVQWLR